MVRPAGVPLAQLRAAVALARSSADGGGLSWPPATWERVWGRITPTQQHVVYLHVLVGLTHTEVADQLGLSRGSVCGAWRRALARIRDALPADR